MRWRIGLLLGVCSAALLFILLIARDAVGQTPPDTFDPRGVVLEPVRR